MADKFNLNQQEIKTVVELMTKKLEHINVLNTGQEAAIKMAERNVSSLAVVDDYGKASGIVTERDLVRRICITDKSSNNLIVQDVMSSPVITISPSLSLEEAAQIMIEKKVRHLLIVNDTNKPVGIITPTNFAIYFKEKIDEQDTAIMQVLREHSRYE